MLNPLFKSLNLINQTKLFLYTKSLISIQQKMSQQSISVTSKLIVPPLTSNKYKGQAGKIGVFGGSFEYTGAPYFAAISALKVGADLVYVFCSQNAGPVIKSYSPELIVLPVLDECGAVQKIEPWLEKLSVVLIGPGLGRNTAIFDTISRIIDICRIKRKPLVIDADGLFLVANRPEVIRDYPAPGVILTPNLVEFKRLFGSDLQPSTITNTSVFDFGLNVTVLSKGAEDIIIAYTRSLSVTGGGSGRRCGGQGDILAGSLATFFGWALEFISDDMCSEKGLLACYAASKLVRECNSRAFQKHGRSMLASDMIGEIHDSFKKLFEN